MRKHLFYYIALIMMSGLSIFLVEKLNFSKQEQFLVVVFLGFFYALWGVLHHVLHHSLRLRIMLEYIAFAMLGIAVTVFILKGII